MIHFMHYIICEIQNMNDSKKPTTTHMVVLHKETEYIEAAVQLLAAQWKHSKFEQMRNQRSMIEDSKDTLPCHLALIDSQDDVVAHVKLTRADGRSDGPCAIFYSLVVVLQKRGLGYGRRMSELAEEFCVALGFAYVYLSTPDMASFYLHLGYKECEPVSSLGNNSKRLTASQVSSIEGIFAKRLNIAPPTEANVWLRRRLIQEFPLRDHILLDDMQSLLKSQLETGETKMFGCVIKVQSQQQSGPSCGISVLNMFNSASTLKSSLLSHKLLLECCSCTILSPNELVEPKTCLDWALKLGISNDGEIFCAFNFAVLAKAAYSLDLEVVDVSDIDEKLLRLKIATSICNGWPVLVAYDRALSDHLPCESNGSLAHWALIFGFITRDSISGSEQNVNCVSNSNVTLFEVDGNKTVKLDKDDVGDKLDIVCYHGMSPRPFVCLLESMLASNRQLMTCKSKFYRHSNDLKHLRNKLLFIKESS